MESEQKPVEQNWQTYRSTLNDKVAIFSANLNLFNRFPDEKMKQVVQFSLSYDCDETGLPHQDQYESLINQTFKALTQLSALPNTCYAGNIMSAGKSTLYFYAENVESFLEVLAQLEQFSEVDVQADPEWDLYFDFLLPSPLEMKINATEEILEMLVQNHRSLSDTYVVEHSLYFEEQDNLQEFIEKMRQFDIPFNAVKYTDEPMEVGDDEMRYLAKVEQELTLDTQDIFQYVEKFENLANQFSGEYIGWECDDLFSNNRLN